MAFFHFSDTANPFRLRDDVFTLDEDNDLAQVDEDASQAGGGDASCADDDFMGIFELSKDPDAMAAVLDDFSSMLERSTSGGEASSSLDKKLTIPSVPCVVAPAVSWDPIPLTAPPPPSPPPPPPPLPQPQPQPASHDVAAFVSLRVPTLPPPAPAPDPATQTVYTVRASTVEAGAFIGMYSEGPEPPEPPLLASDDDFLFLLPLPPIAALAATRRGARCDAGTEVTEADGDLFSLLKASVARKFFVPSVTGFSERRRATLGTDRRARARARLEEKRARWKAAATERAATGTHLKYKGRKVAANGRKRVGGRFVKENKGTFVSVADMQKTH